MRWSDGIIDSMDGRESEQAQRDSEGSGKPGTLQV